MTAEPWCPEPPAEGEPPAAPAGEDVDLTLRVQLGRPCKTQAETSASTWFGKAASMLRAASDEETNPQVAWLIGYDSARLLTSTFSDASLLVGALDDDDQIAEVRRELVSVLSALDARSRATRRARIAGRLMSTAGRTPEEAATYEAKARELLAVN